MCVCELLTAGFPCTQRSLQYLGALISFWRLWRQALGLRWWNWKRFISKHWETSLSWRNTGHSLLWRVGVDSVSAAMPAKRLPHRTASAQKKGENHCLLPRWSLQVTGRKFVQRSQLVIGVVHRSLHFPLLPKYWALWINAPGRDKMPSHWSDLLLFLLCPELLICKIKKRTKICQTKKIKMFEPNAAGSG